MVLCLDCISDGRKEPTVFTAGSFSCLHTQAGLRPLQLATGCAAEQQGPHDALLQHRNVQPQHMHALNEHHI